MLDRKRFSLNRIIAPSLSLAGFYDLAISLGLGKVELRNDIGGRDPIDDMIPRDAARLAADKGIEVISINALQKFNLPTARAKASGELDALLALAKAIGCRAIVLCPNNEAKDTRTPAEKAQDTVAALKEFGPRFEKAGLLGLLEPLGFSISSLASLVVAQEAIKKSGFACYRVVHDTFHHYIGPEDIGILGGVFDVANTGLVHISGVEAPLAKDALRDEHRVLVGSGDVMKNREQIRRLDELGYKGDFSFEPFSPAVQNLSLGELKAEVKKSLDYILG